MSNKTKGVIGIETILFAPTVTQPSGAAATYAASDVDLGHAVKAYLSVQTAELKVYGDDALQIDWEYFQGGQIDTETTLDDLSVEASVYGGTYTNNILTDNATDSAPDGCLRFVSKLLKKDKTVAYRAVLLPIVRAQKSAQKSEADCRKEGLEYKNKPISWRIGMDGLGDWRKQEEFTTLAAATAWLNGLVHPAAGTGSGTGSGD